MLEQDTASLSLSGLSLAPFGLPLGVNCYTSVVGAGSTGEGGGEEGGREQMIVPLPPTGTLYTSCGGGRGGSSPFYFYATVVKTRRGKH